MKLPLSSRASLASLLAILLYAGCTKEAAPPKPITVEQAPTSLEEVFKGASPEAKKLVDDVVGALTAKNYAKALFSLQSLSSRSDLNPQQRDLASRSMLAVNKALDEQASSGDQNAQQALQIRRATK